MLWSIPVASNPKPTFETQLLEPALATNRGTAVRACLPCRRFCHALACSMMTSSLLQGCPHGLDLRYPRTANLAGL